MGEPCGVPTATDEQVIGEPWKRSRHFQLVKKLPTHKTIYLYTPWAPKAGVSKDGSTFSNPPLICRNREGTFWSNRGKEVDFVSEGCGGVEGRESGEGTRLVGVVEAAGPGTVGEAGGGEPFHYLGEGF